LDASLLNFAQDKESSAGAERKRTKLSAVGAEKEKQDEEKKNKKSSSNKSSAFTNMNDAPDADGISGAELKRHHKSVNERLDPADDLMKKMFKTKPTRDGFGEEAESSAPESGTSINF